MRRLILHIVLAGFLFLPFFADAQTENSADADELAARARVRERQEKKTVMTSTIAFASTRHNPAGKLLLDTQIYLMNGDGTNVRRITDNKYADNFPSLSPDGKKIIFYRTIGQGTGRFQLWLINSDGTGEIQMTDTPGLNGFPNWGKVRVPKESR